MKEGKERNSIGNGPMEVLVLCIISQETIFNKFHILGPYGRAYDEYFFLHNFSYYPTFARRDHTVSQKYQLQSVVSGQ
jgi:hypothetical protein